MPVIRPKVSETTCLGAAYAAGLATGMWNDLDELKTHWQKDVEWTPAMEASVRDREHHNWRKAVEKSFGWLEDDGNRAPAGRLTAPWRGRVVGTRCRSALSGRIAGTPCRGVRKTPVRTHAALPHSAAPTPVGGGAGRGHITS